VKKRKCILCHERPAEIPDRDRNDEIDRVCLPCHQRRLGGDIDQLLEYAAKKKRKPLTMDIVRQSFYIMDYDALTRKILDSGYKVQGDWP
jgi:hypothetical protein